MSALPPTLPLPTDGRDGGAMPDDGMGTNETETPQPDLGQHAKLLRWISATNIAADPDIDQSTLSAIGQRVKREYDIDENSRSDWKTRTEKAMEIAMQDAKVKTYPWPQASNVIFPLITTAAIQFAARAYPAIVSGRNVVRGVVIGNDDGVPVIGPDGQPVAAPTGGPVWQTPPGMEQKRADRIGEHMSWQLLDEQPEWEPETDRLLHILPVVGCVFRKSFFDPSKRRNASLMVSAMNLVINYYAKSLETAPRITEVLQFYPLEIEEMERAGIFVHRDYGPAPGGDGDDDAPHKFLEQHRYLDLDDDGYPEPYIVTVHEESTEVVRIVARYDAEGIHFRSTDHRVARIDPIHYYTQYDFLPNPQDGIYGIGFGHLLKPINEAINSTLNQLLDAGHLANTGGGFIGKGLSMAAGAVRFSPGEYKQVNVMGATVRESIVPLQFPGPSHVLFQLLGMLIESGREVASVKDVLTGDAGSKDASPTTTLAMIEQGLKVFTAIYKRIHRALKAELAKLYRLNRIYLPQDASYKVGNDWHEITAADYALGSGVEPVSDPSMVSDMQRLGKAQFLMQFANDPMMDGMEIRRRMLMAAQIEDIDRLLKPAPPPNPAIVAKVAEIAMKRIEVEALAKLREAQAIEALANADTMVGTQQLQALDQMSQHMLAEMEQQANAGNQGSQPGGVPAMAPSPGQQGGAPVPPGP